ncbi:MAG: hypothetical protein DSZ23_01370 [Thermodesulfatator sp.]|nr:MAG: hypothetical protein DSZ23_01370 [Thermodesulfatator sp.]
MIKRAITTLFGILVLAMAVAMFIGPPESRLQSVTKEAERLKQKRVFLAEIDKNYQKMKYLYLQGKLSEAYELAKKFEQYHKLDYMDAASLTKKIKASYRLSLQTDTGKIQHSVPGKSNAAGESTSDAQ